MEHFTIHIFGYGETQINGDEFSVKVSTDSLTTVKPLVDAVWADKPADVNSQQDFHVINIFNYNEIRYIANEDFTLEVNPALKVLIDNLIVELKDALNALPPVVQSNVSTPNVQGNVVTPPPPNMDEPTLII